MSVIKNKLNSRFSQIPNEIITDSNISHGAFRVMVYLFSKPDGWKVYNNDIKKQLKISRSETISKYWKELESAGWISRTKNHNGSFDYILNEKTSTDNAELGSTDNAELLKNRTHSNTELLSKTKKDIYLDIKNEFNISQESIDEILKHRKDIGSKKPTPKALKLMLNGMRKTVHQGFMPNMKSCLRHMIDETTWQSFKPEYFKSKFSYDKPVAAHRVARNPEE